MSDRAAKVLHEIVRAAASGNSPVSWSGPWDALSEEVRAPFRKTAQLIAEADADAPAEETETDD